MADSTGRRRIANDTLFRTPSIIASTPGASGSTFYQDANCPALDDSFRLETPHGPSRVTVVNADSFTAARSIIRRDPTAFRKVAVLNLASDQRPGGGWLESLSRTQVYPRKKAVSSFESSDSS
jgi:Microbial-type PARG, catalytic domain